MIRKIACLFLLFLCSYALKAQDMALPTHASSITFGIGVPINTHRDKAHSTLAYKGGGIRIYIRTEDYRRNSLFRFQASFDGISSLHARMRPKRDINRGAGLSNWEFSWGYYRRVGGELRTNDQQYLGLSYNLQINSRRYPLPANNINGFLLQNSLAIAGVDRRRLGDGDWSVTTHLDVPLFSGVYRPSYIGLSPLFHRQKTGFKDMWRQMEWGSWGLFSKVSLGADFNHQIRDWRANRYSLGWDFFHAKRPKEKPFISTTSSLSYGFNVLF